MWLAGSSWASLRVKDDKNDDNDNKNSNDKNYGKEDENDDNKNDENYEDKDDGKDDEHDDDGSLDQLHHMKEVSRGSAKAIECILSYILMTIWWYFCVFIICYFHEIKLTPQQELVEAKRLDTERVRSRPRPV